MGKFSDDFYKFTYEYIKKNYDFNYSYSFFISIFKLAFDERDIYEFETEYRKYKITKIYGKLQ
jgi:hypothetical protein